MSQRKGRAVQKWEPQEDAQLTKIINSLLADHSWEDIASADWRMVSAKMPGRSTKQCRERYFNVLDPSIVRTPWRAEELDVLFRAHAEVGNSWQEIAKRIPGRSESQVKNVYYSAVRRAQRETERLGSEVPPSFIVGQTAEREAKAGHCSLPSVVETSTPTMQPHNRSNNAPPGGTPESDGSPHGGMMPTPYSSPGAGPALPPATLPPAAMSTRSQTQQSMSQSQDSRDSFLPPSATSASMGMSLPEQQMMSHLASRSRDAAVPVVMPHYSPVLTASIAGQHTPSLPQYSMQSQQQMHAQSQPHPGARLPARFLAGQQHAALSSMSAVLPNVVPSGAAPSNTVHVYRRKHLGSHSPVTGVTPPPNLSIPSASLGQQALDMGTTSDQEGNLTPSVHYERHLQTDGDGDVDLDQENERIDSWLKPTSGTASPHLSQAASIHGLGGVGQSSMFGGAQMQGINTAHTGYSGQMFVAGSASPSLMLAGGAYTGMLPQAPPSAFFASVSPNAQSSRVG